MQNTRILRCFLISNRVTLSFCRQEISYQAETLSPQQIIERYIVDLMAFHNEANADGINVPENADPLEGLLINTAPDCQRGFQPEGINCSEF